MNGSKIVRPSRKLQHSQHNCNKQTVQTYPWHQRQVDALVLIHWVRRNAYCWLRRRGGGRRRSRSRSSVWIHRIGIGVSRVAVVRVYGVSMRRIEIDWMAIAGGSVPVDHGGGGWYTAHSRGYLCAHIAVTRKTKRER